MHLHVLPPIRIKWRSFYTISSLHCIEAVLINSGRREYHFLPVHCEIVHYGISSICLNIRYLDHNLFICLIYFWFVFVANSKGFDDMDSIYASPTDFQSMKQRDRIRWIHLLEYFVNECHRLGVVTFCFFLQYYRLQSGTVAILVPNSLSNYAADKMWSLDQTGGSKGGYLPWGEKSPAWSSSCGK